jgi:hypothetical protein
MDARDACGLVVPDAWLFSYQPTPGTVVFAGYGRSLADPDSVRSEHLHRVGDGFFLKWTYLFRV